jgi:hypothetical protein
MPLSLCLSLSQSTHQSQLTSCALPLQNIEGPNPKNYFMGDNGKLKMGILPVSIFCSGHTYFVQRMADRLKLQVYAVHATFQFSGVCVCVGGGGGSGARAAQRLCNVYCSAVSTAGRCVAHGAVCLTG